VNYDQALEYIHNLTTFGFNFGLERITELLERFYNPHEKLKIIHVGGTNGKGSTSAMISSILKESGYKVGMYISPHLHSYTERFTINGNEIDKQELAEIISQMKPQLEDMVKEGFEHPTEFEVGTAIALLYFFRQRVDFLVFEVGLGGTIDSTNVVNPILSVITNVSRDHMDYLGETVEEIATVKAGIIKKGRPVVTAAKGKPLEIIIRKCRELDSEVILVGKDLVWKAGSFDCQGQFLDVTGLLKNYKDLYIPLIGDHQQINATTAIAVIEELVVSGHLAVSPRIREGLAKTHWPARLEIVCREPLVIIDGAHNYEGALSLKKSLELYFPGMKRYLVLGMLADKERSRVIGLLAPGAKEIIITKPNSPRASDCSFLALEARRHVEKVRIIENIITAVKAAISVASPRDLVIITGSIYMVAEAREFLLGL
jgi:dihydrofolate synthase/folylpolyglutamate synthase